MKVFFYTFGCKVNQYDTGAMAESLRQHGYISVKTPETADVVVINSCTVTAESDRKLRQTLRRIRRQSPGCVLVLCGCFPQAFPDDASSMDEPDIILGSQNRIDLHNYLETFFQTHTRIIAITAHQKVDSLEQPNAAEAPNVALQSERTRAFVKIEDGCNRYCSYCIIPYARGRVRSKPLDALKAELEELATNQFSEVVLVGINLSAYGSDLGLTLCDAVAVAEQTHGIRRVRLGSLEPDLFTPKMITQLTSFKKLCGQFHLSLQSGCDATLRRMNRLYTSQEYFDIVKELRNRFENCAITTDVIVGFPGETDLEFQETLDLISQIGFAKIHIFPYSRRPGTKAADLPDQVTPAVRQIRVRTLSALEEKMREQFLLSQTGTTAEVLAETPRSGYSKNYTPVVFQPAAVPGEIIKIHITGATDGHCVGEIIPSMR